MSSFTDPLQIEPAGKGKWRLCRGLRFDLGFKGSKWSIEVPSGYVTDLATVPRFLWWLYPPFSPEYAAAAVIHDWLYLQTDASKTMADAAFLEGLEVLGVSHFKRLVMYWSVSIFGGRKRGMQNE